MNRFSKFFNLIENAGGSVYFWIFSIFGIIFLRNFFEMLSSVRYIGGDIFTVYSFFVHMPFFYFVTLLAFILFFYFLSRKGGRDIVKITKVFLSGFIIIWLAPILDIILTRGGGEKISYLDLNSSSFFDNLFYLLRKPSGVSSGIRIELILIFSFIAVYFYYKNRSVILTFINFLLNYFLGFFLGSLPATLAYTADFFDYLKFSFTFHPIAILHSHFLKIASFENSILQSSGFFYLSDSIFYKIWDHVLSWFLIILTIVLINIWFYLYDKNKFRSFWGNARFERVIYYLSFIFIGFFTAYKLGVFNFPFNFFNTLNLLVLMIAVMSSWLLAVGFNDIYDQNIDRIVHSERPLIKKTLSVEDFKIYNFFLILIILFSGLVLNYEIFLLLIIANAGAFIYSCPPLRLRRIPILSNVFLSIAGVAVISMGFSLASGGLWFGKFPLNLIFILATAIFFIAQIKDIKDINGDKSENIKTIPVIFGEKIGKLIISFMVFSALILIALIMGGIFNIFMSVIFGVAAFILINKKEFKEINLFILFFIYILNLFISNYLIK